ncbi:MAG: hypothetical protein L3J30_09190 [Marinosulfonomonas sp.]|nr:hypothetical protein [Marinosulfonomonas sp.]
MGDAKPGLNTVYSLKTPQDSIKLYGNWAATYDADFAVANDCRYPALIAEVFTVRAQDSAGSGRGGWHEAGGRRVGGTGHRAG